MLFASLVLASCNSKEIATPDGGSSESGIPFEVSTVITKTANDGLQTNWASGDAINLFHAEAGTTSSYTSDGKFTVDKALTGVFSGELAKALEEGNSYDWYAFYPYDDYNKTPAGVSKDTFGYTTVGGTSQTQTGNNSRAHLAGTNCPLYGVVKTVLSSDKPAFVMNQLVSVVAVNVTNTLADAITVSNVSFTSTEDIVGAYYIDFSGETPKYTSRGGSYVSETAELIVKDGASIAQNESATFYIAIKPHTAGSGNTLKISVNGIEKTLTLTKDVTFEAGYIKTVKYSYEPVYVSVPWTEDFSEGLDAYLLVNGDSETKTYNEELAGGESPELLVGKKTGSFSAYVKTDGTSKLYRLTFKSNNYDYVTVSSSTEGVTITKDTKTSGKYLISLPEGVDKFKLSFENSASKNYRLDDISLVSDNSIKLSAPQNVMASLNEDDANVTNAIDVVWDEVENAGSYVVTATPASGKSATAEVSTTSCTITDLLYETEYTISVYAKSSDVATYEDSDVTEYSEKVTTGANQASVITYQHIFLEKPSTGDNVKLSNVSWNLTAIKLGSYNSGNYAGVQFGDKSNAGSITLTSSDSWSYSGKSKIKEVRIWLNAGTGTPTATVTVGGKEAVSDGTVVKKNSSAKSYLDATKVTFTPATDGDSGVVVIKVATTSKAAYFCAMEIDCE